MSNKVDKAAVTEIQEDGMPACPHCHNRQDHIDEHETEALYECEFCWEKYFIPVALLADFRRQEKNIKMESRMDLLGKRVERLEKELGIK